MNQPRLSKSRYMSGKQCHLRLWYDVHERRLASPIDEAQQAIFDTGHEVGDLARERYPDGHLVSHDYRHIPQALTETWRLVESGTAPTLFEAAFQHNGVLARVDVLERMPGGGWRMVEVKSTTRCKPEHPRTPAVSPPAFQHNGVLARVERLSIFSMPPCNYGCCVAVRALGWMCGMPVCSR